MKVGDKAYIVESNQTIREVEIRRCSGGLFLVRFTDNGGGIQVRRNRLFATMHRPGQMPGRIVSNFPFKYIFLIR